MRSRRARGVTWIAGSLAAGVIAYAICEQRALRAECAFRRLREMCEGMPLESLEDHARWERAVQGRGEKLWAAILEVRELGGQELYFRRMAAGDRRDMVIAAFAVGSLHGNVWAFREDLDRLRRRYSQRIDERAAALFAPDSSERKLIHEALEVSRVITIQRSDVQPATP